ncbi:MAG: hypothetical protein GX333_00555 [Syntrophomonadaceae bacterium]|nr:hypothetical protein [Syntrophomonadaceae bacterium]
MEPDIAKISFSDNPFFCQDSVVTYQGVFNFADFIKKDINLNVDEVASLEDGKLYELKLELVANLPEECLDLGYFYVQKHKTYKLEATNEDFDQLINDGILPNDSLVVCQEQAIEDLLDEDEAGFHYFLDVDADKREFFSYNYLMEDEFLEMFIWEKHKGLTYYRKGLGAEVEAIELELAN